MPKPPRKIAASSPQDSPTTHRPFDAGSHHPPNQQFEATTLTARAVSDSVGEMVRPPTVEVSNLHPNAAAVEAATRMITWPVAQLDQLRPIGNNSGLFESPDARLYANLGAEGYFQVRRNADNSYQVPLPFAPDLPGPMLEKLDGQPIWRIIPPNWLLQPAVESSIRAGNRQPSPPMPVFIKPQAAHALSAADDGGIRHDKLKKTYVELPEGIAMVFRHANGKHQLTSARELHPSGPFVERTVGSLQWRLIPDFPETP